MLKPPRKCTVLITSTLRCHQLPYGAISFPGRVWVPLTFEERNLQRRECPAPGAPNSTEDQRCQPKNPISQIQCISVDYGGPLIDFPPKKSTKQNLPCPPPKKKGKDWLYIFKRSRSQLSYWEISEALNSPGAADPFRDFQCWKHQLLFVVANFCVFLQE